MSDQQEQVRPPGGPEQPDPYEAGRDLWDPEQDPPLAAVTVADLPPVPDVLPPDPEDP